MRLGIDLDGVVADFSTGWVNRYNDEFRRFDPDKNRVESGFYHR